MKLNTLRDLYLEQLKDLHSAETQITAVLPAMIEHTTNQHLKSALEQTLTETKTQAGRLEQIGTMMNETLSGHFCKGMQGVLSEGTDLLKDADSADPAVLDAGIITSVQRIKHYEMAGYGTARAYAEILNESSAMELLDASLSEEGETNKNLIKIALSEVDRAAAEAG